MVRLRTPAIHRILEIAGDGEAHRREPHRNPVDVMEYLLREFSEIAVVLRRARSPFVFEDAGQPIQHRAARAGQDQEPENHAEHMAVRVDQSFLDGTLAISVPLYSAADSPRNSVSSTRARSTSPTRNASTISVNAWLNWRKTHRQIKHHDVPDPGGGDADVEQEIMDGQRHQHPRQHGQQPGNHALVLLPALKWLPSELT